MPLVVAADLSMLMSGGWEMRIFDFESRCLGCDRVIITGMIGATRVEFWPPPLGNKKVQFVTEHAKKVQVVSGPISVWVKTP